MALCRLAGSEGVAGLVEHHRLKSRWKLRGDELVARELFPWCEVDRLIAEHRLSTESFHIVVNQHHVSPHLYTEAGSGRLRSAVLQGMAEQGATFVLTGVQYLVPAVGRLTGDIERLIATNVQANAYLSFGEESAFAAHRDDHDVLVVQVDGSKHWRSYGMPERFPIKGGPVPGLAVEWEDRLEPGDLLYLPRGEVHAAMPVERPSLHLTIGISEKTGVDFVRSLAETAEAQDVFRHSLSRHRTAAQERELKQAMHALIDSASLDAFLAHDDQRRRLKPAVAFDFSGRLHPDTRLASTVLRRLPLHPDEPNEVKLVLGGQAIRLAQLERRALDRLWGAGHLSLGDLASALEIHPEDSALSNALATLARHTLIEILSVRD